MGGDGSIGETINGILDPSFITLDIRLNGLLKTHA